MADEFFLDQDTLSQATGGLRSEAADFGRALAGLINVTQQLDGCWGNDDAGKSFANNYVKPAGEAISGSQQIHKGVNQTSDELDNSANQFAGLDKDAAKQLDQQYAESNSDSQQHK